MIFLAIIFTGGGIGLLISPAFVEQMVWWNMLGLPCVFIGWYFMGKVYDST
jgi:hypothetical protein